MTLDVELLDDGGIRVTAPGSSPGLASRRMAIAWVEVAAERGWTLAIRGDGSPDIAGQIRGDAAARNVVVHADATSPAPWPRGWSSLQIAASSGLTEQVQDLVARGAPMNSRRRDQSPYRLAMRHGHIDTLVALRDAGAPRPPGSRPPTELPNAVVLRNYLPSFIWWLAVAVGALGLVLAAALQQWPFLIVAASGAAAILIGNAAIGMTRIAVDGPRGERSAGAPVAGAVRPSRARRARFLEGDVDSNVESVVVRADRGRTRVRPERPWWLRCRVARRARGAL